MNQNKKTIPSHLHKLFLPFFLSLTSLIFRSIINAKQLFSDFIITLLCLIILSAIRKFLSSQHTIIISFCTICLCSLLYPLLPLSLSTLFPYLLILAPLINEQFAKQYPKKNILLFFAPLTTFIWAQLLPETSALVFSFLLTLSAFPTFWKNRREETIRLFFCSIFLIITFTLIIIHTPIVQSPLQWPLYDLSSLKLWGQSPIFSTLTTVNIQAAPLFAAVHFFGILPILCWLLLYIYTILRLYRHSANLKCSLYIIILFTLSSLISPFFSPLFSLYLQFEPFIILPLISISKGSLSIAILLSLLVSYEAR